MAYTTARKSLKVPRRSQLYDMTEVPTKMACYLPRNDQKKKKENPEIRSVSREIQTGQQSGKTNC
jgi:hypothetical protein